MGETPRIEGKDLARPALAAAGGVLGALAASSCCIAPLVLFSLGATGAWLGNLAALASYQPIIIAVTFGFLGWGFWMTYGKPRTAAVCAEPACRVGPRARATKAALWSAAVLVAAAIAFPYVAPPLLGI